MKIDASLGAVTHTHTHTHTNSFNRKNTRLLHPNTKKLRLWTIIMSIV